MTNPDDFLAFLRQRHSVRAFLPAPVPQAVLALKQGAGRRQGEFRDAGKGRHSVHDSEGPRTAGFSRPGVVCGRSSISDASGCDRRQRRIRLTPAPAWETRRCGLGLRAFEAYRGNTVAAGVWTPTTLVLEADALGGGLGRHSP